MGWDLTLLAAVQSLHAFGGRALDIFFLIITFLGEETFVVLCIAGIYWCVNKRAGEFLILSLYITSSFNAGLKDIVRRPRPFIAHADSVRHVEVENALIDTKLANSFSFPSGHSQSAAALFGGFALWVKKRGVSLLALALTLLVMLSRVYLGVHYPSDVLGGALISFALTFLCHQAFIRFYKNKLFVFSAVVAVSLVTLLVSPTSDTFKTVGLGLGVLAGVILDEKTLKFEISGSTGRKILRLVLGFLMAFMLRVGLKAFLPVSEPFDCLRYAVLGVFIIYLWPLAFTKLKI